MIRYKNLDKPNLIYGVEINTHKTQQSYNWVLISIFNNELKIIDYSIGEKDSGKINNKHPKAILISGDCVLELNRDNQSGGISLAHILHEKDFISESIEGENSKTTAFIRKEELNRIIEISGLKEEIVQISLINSFSSVSELLKFWEQKKLKVNVPGIPELVPALETIQNYLQSSDSLMEMEIKKNRQNYRFEALTNHLLQPVFIVVAVISLCLFIGQFFVKADSKNKSQTMNYLSKLNSEIKIKKNIIDNLLSEREDQDYYTDLDILKSLYYLGRERQNGIQFERIECKVESSNQKIKINLVGNHSDDKTLGHYLKKLRSLKLFDQADITAIEHSEQRKKGRFELKIEK